MARNFRSHRQPESLTIQPRSSAEVPLPSSSWKGASNPQGPAAYPTNLPQLSMIDIRMDSLGLNLGHDSPFKRDQGASINLAIQQSNGHQHAEKVKRVDRFVTEKRWHGSQKVRTRLSHAIEATSQLPTTAAVYHLNMSFATHSAALEAESSRVTFQTLTTNLRIIDESNQQEIPP